MPENNEITFKVFPRLIKWMDGHNKKYHSYATAGEHYIFEFLPSGIIECQTIKCLICKEEFTDYV